MYQKRSLNVIPLILTALVIVVSFAFVVSAPVSASNAEDALFPEPGEISGQLVLDENMPIDESASVVHRDGLSIGYTNDLSEFEGFTPNYVRLGDISFASAGFGGTKFKEGSVLHIVDVEGISYDIPILTTLSSGKLEDIVSSVDAERVIAVYVSTENPNVFGFDLYQRWFSTGTPSLYGSYNSSYLITPVSSSNRDSAFYADGSISVVFLSADTPVSVPYGNNQYGLPFYYFTASQYVVLSSFSIEYSSVQYWTGGTYMTSHNLYNVLTGETTQPWSGLQYQYYPAVIPVWEENIGSDVSQRLYVLKDEIAKKYYLWLIRNDYGSSIIIEGSASAGLPAFTAVNGGRDYTDNYYVTLDMYDAFNVPYQYSVQVNAFNSNNVVKKWTYEFGGEGGSSGPDDDTTPITPPGQIEIPDIIGGVVSTPGELPSLYLPFDFESPSLTVDFTSGFDYAFNSTWLGVSDVYRDVTSFIDGLVVKFVPDVSGVFGSIVYTIETYADSFRDMCRDMRNTYAVPFYNLVVKVSSLVPAPVWVVFDIWLFYCSARLIIYVFTCPLSDVIRRYF